ncbi:MAG: T9SS type A sorting domain-containing protein, partial [Saprospiraceae bacterium]|nr:T9SS type A sorting domain-containing protein [Saprospiraceae bacterium]MCF8281752.1 T9SS type A sorting domain-containing protein [Bacteroidales bacterium]MCF8310360.1 T9SS type A sorting domain-containing protein [Saprospiraceae bacterium]MCF8439738.1 T9SS type A sorting domain-containing protein [Saprospiraceae bacterium]
SEGQTLAEGQSFTLAPNPAGSFVNITVSENLAEGQTTLALWDLQGRKHQEILLKNTITQLDLGDLPAGMYMVSLAQNGRVVERKKLVKN